jgi:pimeloyl-ACP methyl ester carboxylesterase
VPGAARVVVVPGLGAPTYLAPLARELDQRGLAVSVLDLPGFGRVGPLDCAPTPSGIAAAVVRHVREHPPDGRRVLLAGHSTGAVAALRAALQLQDEGALVGVLLAAPVFAPGQRTWAGVARAAVPAYRRDSPRELRALPDYWRGRRHLPSLLRAGLAERPEQDVGRLRLPLTLTAGRADTFAPPWWLAQLAAAASPAAAPRVVLLAGSHNNPFTHPEQLGALIASRALPRGA